MPQIPRPDSMLARGRSGAARCSSCVIALAVVVVATQAHGSQPSWTVQGNEGSLYLGVTVARAGDVNGDGYSDVMIGSSQGVLTRVYLGGPSGLASVPAWTWPHGGLAGAAGDVNGDGYGDLIVNDAEFGYSFDGSSLFYGSASGLATEPVWSVVGTQGWVAGAGDVNGDGYADLVVGVEGHANGEEDEGVAFVYHGSTSGPSLVPDWTVEGNQTGALFGHCVASAGDVNGDGYGDVVIGAKLYDGGLMDEGGAFLYLGSATGLATTPAWTAEGDQLEAIFGVRVASAGDVNADGYGDVIVGAAYYDAGQDKEGRAFVYLGSATGLSTVASWTAESNQVEAYAGIAVASAGDFDGDGYGDVIIGANGYDHPLGHEGAAWIYRGSATGLLPNAWWMRRGEQMDAVFGQWLDGAGDVNGDGVADVIIGAPYFDEGETNEGKVFVYHGIRRNTTGVAESRPVGPWLRGARPNPSEADVAVEFSLAARGRVDLTVYDLFGRRLATLARGTLEAGIHRGEWNGCGPRGARVPAGIYLLRLESAGVVRTAKIVRR